MEKLSLYERAERNIGNGFASLGRLISRHPKKFLFVTIFINLALGIGLVNLDMEVNAEKIYVPLGSDSERDVKRIREIFPDLSRSNFQILQWSTDLWKWASIIIRAKSGNILEGNALTEVASLNDVISQIKATRKDGSEIKITDICAMTKINCYVEGSMFWSSEFLDAVQRNNISFPWFISSERVSNYKSYIGGRVDRNETHLFGMEYIRIEYIFRTDIDVTDDILCWCDEFIKVLQRYSGENIEVLYAHYDSLDEELHDNVLGDLSLYAVTVAVMMTYSIMATVSARITDSVGQRMWLGIAGWSATGLSILSAVGLCSAVGVKFSTTVGISPFLVSGIGIDDMFILLSGLSAAQTQTTVSDKLAETMRVSGVGITITTLTDLLAFGCGASSTFLSVRNFCIYTGVAVTFCYINNITILGACITLNERRVEQNKHWLTLKVIPTREQAEQEGQKRSRLFCCTGRPPTSREEAESFLDKFPRWILPKIVLYKPFKIVICFLFVGYLAGAIYGCIHLEQGLRFSELPSDDSYFYRYSKTLEVEFPLQSPAQFVIPQYYDYSDPVIQQNMELFMRKVKADEYFESDFGVNWLTTYKTTEYYQDTSEQAFIMGLERFINDSFYSSFQNDIVIDATKSRIVASRVYGRSRHLLDSQEAGRFMLRARELAEDFELECFSFYPSFFYYEQYVLVLNQTMLTVGIALAVVLVVTCFFMPHPVLILFCFIAVTMIMTGVIGYMVYIDKALSGITMIQIIMGIGFSVDFTAHMCHGYLASKGDSREEKVRGAIDKTASPITHGAISSVLGVSVLGASKSYIFRTFAAVVAFILSFGWAHATLLLPVVLSWIGPGTFKSNKSSKYSPKPQPDEGEPYKLSVVEGGIPQNGAQNVNHDGRLQHGTSNHSMSSMSSMAPLVGSLPN